MRRLLMTTLLGVALATGCGSDDEEEGAGSKTQEAQTQTQPAVSEQTKVRVLGERYLKAYRRREWSKLCATLAPRDQERLAQREGSCAKAWEDEPRESVRLAKFLTIQQVRVDGDRATMVVAGYTEDNPADRLFGVKIDGKWWIDLARAERRVRRQS